MATYEFTCDECDLLVAFEISIKVGPPEKVDCPECPREMRRVRSGVQVCVPGKREEYDPAKNGMGINLGERLGRSPEQQIRNYQKVMKEEAEVNREVRRRGLDRKDGIRKIGCIPREAWIARTRQHGKNYWQHDDVRKLVKRDGFLLEDN